MQKYPSPFTDAEKELLYGTASKVAARHEVTPVYVNNIIAGRRNTRSKRAQAILADLKETAKFLMRPAVPVPQGIKEQTMDSSIASLSKNEQQS